MWQTFEIVFRVGVFVGIALFMWSVSSSLEQLARDVSLLTGRAGAKPPVDDVEGPVGA